MFHIELIIEFLENVMNNIVQVAILFFEFVGVIVIILSGLKGFYNYVRRVPDMKITLAQGLAVGLEFKLCSEILNDFRSRGHGNERQSPAGFRDPLLQFLRQRQRRVRHGLRLANFAASDAAQGAVQWRRRVRVYGWRRHGTLL